MFILENEGLKLILEVVPVDSLFIHERVVPPLIDELLLEFKSWASLENPIIMG